ncbi:MAG: phage tail sheath family protein [Gammaproteobacteria bacterium]|nr:MAG: phage tail sheath family protein [Gammaproteobacteria bacterium]
MATYSTPGVYVEEISTFPPSVAEVSTAIPAFIGYTETGPAADKEPSILRINTLLDYETHFGKAQPSNYAVNASFDVNNQAWTINELGRSVANNNNFLMYYALSLYFKNGGGSCYIVSIGNYTDAHDTDHFNKGLGALEKEDEPTLIIAPDALELASADYYSFSQAMLAQCNKLRDRFSILDVPDGEEQAVPFRNGIGMTNLMYGAAYHPHLKTALSYHYLEAGVTVTTESEMELAPATAATTWQKAFGDNGIIISFTGVEGDEPKARISSGTDTDPIEFEITSTNVLRIANVATKTGTAVVDAWNLWSSTSGNNPNGYGISINGNGSGDVQSTGNSNEDLDIASQDTDTAPGNSTMASLKDSNTSLYNQLKTLLNAQRVILPPSSAIAGIYARVDRNRGVWKAPANEGLSSVIAPVRKITNEEQGRLNIDTNAGKSINAIRAFTGKGTLVWGARTLAGNDNEWRYISVRRLFNMIEESSQKSTAFAVFEANDATTWLKVKAMIESFLFSLWERGALAGSTPESAYFVNVGLGKTMTTQDILEGRMNVEIGIAAVRPAEFIILKFSHKLQEA